VDEVIETEAGAAAGEAVDGDGEVMPHHGWIASLFDRRREEEAPAATADSPGAEPEATDEPALEEATADAQGPNTHDKHDEVKDERNVAAFRAGMAEITDPRFDIGATSEPSPETGTDEVGAPTEAGDEAEPAEKTSDLPDDLVQVGSYRQALLGARDEPKAPARGLGSLNTQLKIGLLSALALVIVLATVLLTTQAPRTGPTASSSAPAIAVRPSAAATPTRSAAPSPVPSVTSTAPAIATLTEVVTAGAGGGGWQVSRIRTGSPNAASGITRVVFDLEGPGAQPDAKMGRGSDGAIYLTVPGITISPAIVSGFGGAGPITGMTQTGTQGLALRLTTNGSPGFSIGYLSVPNRLVLDFK
jgi:hypothetical protein